MKECLVLNQSGVNEDEEEEDVAQDTNDGDDAIYTTVHNNVQLFVNTWHQEYLKVDETICSLQADSFIVYLPSNTFFLNIVFMIAFAFVI